MVDGTKGNAPTGAYEEEQAAWGATRPLFSDMVRDGATNIPIYTGESSDIEEEDFQMGDIIGTQTRTGETTQHPWP